MKRKGVWIETHLRFEMPSNNWISQAILVIF